MHTSRTSRTQLQYKRRSSPSFLRGQRRAYYPPLPHLPPRDAAEPRILRRTGLQLDEILRPYIESVEDARKTKGAKVKPMVVVCLTDGRADDSDLVKEGENLRARLD